MVSEADREGNPPHRLRRSPPSMGGGNFLVILSETKNPGHIYRRQSRHFFITGLPRYTHNDKSLWLLLSQLPRCFAPPGAGGCPAPPQTPPRSAFSKRRWRFGKLTSITHRPKQAPAQSGVALGVGTAAARTAGHTIGKRTARVVEHPKRNRRMCHFTPTVQSIFLTPNNTNCIPRIYVRVGQLRHIPTHGFAVIAAEACADATYSTVWERCPPWADSRKQCTR